jgi:glutamate-1-semialdehyde 2,1-aminomutase
MQGSGGCIPGDPTFLTALRALCTESGALLIFDEVMTSRFARGGAQQLLGITPDLTTLGKYLAGGLTFGAFGGRRDVMAAFDPTGGGALSHPGTFNNNVTSMAAGVAALTEVLTDERLNATNTRGEHLRVSLNERFSEHGLPLTATGTQSLMTVHGTAGPVHSASDLVDADDRWKELFFFHLLAAGIYIARRGFIALSIEVTDADIAHVLGAVDDFCESFS